MKTLFDDTKRAVAIANEILKEPDEQIIKIDFLNMHLKVCMELGKT